jgi:pimeloyl-ACP methyl ester carboxylesterase/DNA-binding winged helix-turn-helix (wHTH) protein
LIYVFEPRTLDVDRRELRHGADVTAVEPQVFDILEYLIRHRERVVGGRELIAAVWCDRVISESTLSSRISAARQAIGDSGEKQSLIRTVSRKGYRFVGAVREERGSEGRAGAAPSDAAPSDAAAAPSAGAQASRPAVHAAQAVRFCKSHDGVNLAVATAGRGPPLVKAAHWTSNLEYDWQNPLTGPLLQRLAGQFRVVRYDGRGTGLSDRDVPSISLETFVRDLETVVDGLGLERFALLGISGGAAASIAYTVRNPKRVSKLVLYGSYALGRNKRGSPQDLDEAKAFHTMARGGWSEDRALFMRAFFSFWLPTGSPEELQSLMDLQRVSVPAENAAKIRIAVDDIDVVELLPKIAAPTLVLHCLDDKLVPFEQGRRLAASIPNSRFVALESANHALLAREPAWDKFMGEMEEFLTDSR